MKTFAAYSGALLLAVAVVAGLGWPFTDEAGRQTLLASGLVALAVQLMAFGVARAMREKQLLLGWGLGSLLRLIALVLYAVFVARLWRAPVTPALLSLAGMLFVSTVVEPIFLKR